MSDTIQRQLYLGANTRNGFVSLYGRLFDSDLSSIYILKGGPGCGKSTFIRRCLRFLNDEGYDSDALRCSADASSLDGLLCSQAGIAIVDGTSPHSLDNIIPGARDNIVDLGRFWKSERLKANFDSISGLLQEKSLAYKRAYSYLKAAGAIYDGSKSILESCLEYDKLSLFADSLSDELLCGAGRALNIGKHTDSFASAVTESGVVNELTGLFSGSRIYSLKSVFALETKTILDTLDRKTRIAGYDTERYICGFGGRRVEHINIPKLGVALITTNDYHGIDNFNVYYEYPLDGFLSHTRYYSDELSYNRIRFDELLNMAATSLREARQIHGDIEKYYTDAMDFYALDSFLHSFINKLGCSLIPPRTAL